MTKQAHSSDFVSCQDLPEQQVCQPIPAERRFHQIAYGGISYAAQALTGLFLLNSAKHGKGQKLFEWASKGLGIKDSWLIVTTMVMVGNAYLLPVKWLENHKPKVVRWLNDHINAWSPPTPEERARQEARLQQIEQEPRQTWWSLGSGRLFGLAAVYATLYGLGEERNKIAEQWTVKNVLRGLDFAGLKKTAKSQTLKNLLGIGFYEGFYSIISAGGLFVYSHIIQPPKKSGITVKVQHKDDAAPGLDHAVPVEVTGVAEPRRKTGCFSCRFTHKEKPEPMRGGYMDKVNAEAGQSAGAQPAV